MEFSRGKGVLFLPAFFAPSAASVGKHPILSRSFLGKMLQPGCGLIPAPTPASRLLRFQQNQNPIIPLTLNSPAATGVSPCAGLAVPGRREGAGSSTWELMSVIYPAEMTSEMHIISNMQMRSLLHPV